MTTNNISVFSQPIVKSDVSSVSKGKDDINLTDADMFSEFMDRSASMQAPDINADKQETGAPAKSSATPEESYNKMQSGSHSNVKSKEETKEIPEVASPEVKNKVSEKTEKIKEALKEELNVTDEDIEKVMELLGLTDFDLFDRNAFVQLVTELSDSESAVDLLSMPGMNELLDDVSQIVKETAAELSVAPDDLSDVLKQMEEPAENETFVIPEEAVEVSADAVVTDTKTVDADVSQKADIDKNVSQQAAAEVEQADVKVETERVTAEVNRNTVKTADNENVSQNTEKTVAEPETEKASARVEVQIAGENTGKENSDDAFESQTQTFTKKESAANVSEEAVRVTAHNTADTGLHAAVDAHAQTLADVNDVQSYIDVDNLIEQFATLTKNLENEQTTLSMRLNPENLGQLTLHVTEKQGNLTAEVKVENEQVRDALNAQIAELRANLENAGVKVNAVEVTVESHEFESAYESQTGGAETGNEGRGNRNPENPDEASEKTNGIRNINLNNPEEIADNLTEAEIVNASVMRDNGNTMDFRA